MYKYSDYIDKVVVTTENGEAKRVFIGGKEMRGVTGINVKYGVHMPPEVTLTFVAADVKISETGVKE